MLNLSQNVLRMLSVTNDLVRIKGIVLRVIPFKDYDVIIVLFTRDLGVVKLVCKKARSKHRGWLGLCLPLNVLEVIYKERQTELQTCIEISFVSNHEKIKHSLEALDAACAILRLLFQTQLPGKSAPFLYDLTETMLQKMTSFESPLSLVTIFRLKLLLHDGLLGFPFQCATCGVNIDRECGDHGGEWYCLQHTLSFYRSWSLDELSLLYTLIQARKISELQKMHLPLKLQKKIEKLFECILSLE